MMPPTRHPRGAVRGDECPFALCAVTVAGDPSPFGAYSSKYIARCLLSAWRTGRTPLLLCVQGGTLDDLRRELRHRETLGVEVRL